MRLGCGYVSASGLALAFAAGCGGGEIDRESIASCLRESDAEVSTNLDDGFFYLYSSLSDPVWEREGLVVSIGDNEAALAVARHGDEAEAFVSLVELSVEGGETPSEDVLTRYGNVAVEWSETPTAEETETLEGCVP